jgi:anti-sigma factor RsiW
MNCQEAQRLLDAYVDDEIDLRGAIDIEQHLEACKECAGEVERLRELQKLARTGLTRYEMPRRLEAKLLAPTRRKWRWMAIAPAAAAAVILFAVWPRQPGITDAIVDAHARSLMADHLTDVVSSDKHTVKPWFQGRVDYGVSVGDFAAQGFPLIGGRLDYLDGSPAAALVYKRAKHVINLFVWPGKHAEEHVSRRGYGAYFWSKGDMQYCAISDLNDAELREFVELAKRE